MTSINEMVKNKTLTIPNLPVQSFLDVILERYGDKVLGIFMYGSVLSDVTRSSTSFPDFFVITENYRNVFKHWLHWLLAFVLPPHIYHLRLSNTEQCKYNLVSLKRFRKECSKKAKDIYILGRFGKRVALVYSRDELAQNRLIDCCESAMTNLVPWVIRGLDKPFDATEFALACLNISYAGETRVEASSKVTKLFLAEKDFYLQVYPFLLFHHPYAKKTITTIDSERFQTKGSRIMRWLRRLYFRWFLKRSRIRGILRWPKFLVTVEGWVDIILAKIERTKGIKLEVTEKEKKHPLIYGWPYFFRLIRMGAIGSPKSPPDSPQKK